VLAETGSEGEQIVTDVEDVVIIGSGPAGLTAAIYSARANLRPLVIEGETIGSDQPGGQLMLTTDVENFPGFIDGIMGPELMGNMRAQAERFGARFVTKRVESVDLASSPKRVVTDGGEVLTRVVIVATGAKALMLGLENERRLLGYGVSTCATCDGFFFRERHIVVVGG
jgi:thioredoxin reductase (NADPH)